MINLGSTLQSNMPTKNSSEELLKAKSTRSNENVSSKKSESSDRSSANANSTSAKNNFSEKFSDSLDKANIKSDETQPVGVEKASTQTISENRKEAAPRAVKDTVESAPVTKEAAMTVFLNKMHSELGIAPNQVLEAFSKLTGDDLLAAPEASANKVIALLGLDDKKTGKALDLYSEMLAMTAAVNLHQYNTSRNSQASLKVVDQNAVNLANLRKSIDSMNNQFFVSSPQPQQSQLTMQTAAQQQFINQGSSEQLSMSAEQKQNANSAFVMPEIAPGLAAETPLAAQSAGSGTGASSGMSFGALNNAETPHSPELESEYQKIMSKFKPIDTNSEKLADVNPSPSTMPDVSAMNADTMALPELESATSGIEYTSPQAGTMSSSQQVVASASSLGNSMGGDDSESSSEGEAGLEANQFDGINQLNKSEAVKSADVKTFTINTTPTTADVQNNVKDIISKAQYLADKGGGEMKVKLNPEGIGEVNLRVKMMNGQVNVEMMAETHEAKKVLEQGLGELKESLALHKLNLDSVKIDAGKDISSQLDQQRRDMENSFQQKFLGDFRERNSGFRREMFEFGAPSVPRSQAQEAISSSYNVNKKRNANSNRRLDLVA